jgi:hypothetical protein
MDDLMRAFHVPPKAEEPKAVPPRAMERIYGTEYADPLYYNAPGSQKGGTWGPKKEGSSNQPPANGNGQPGKKAAPASGKKKV